MVWLSVIVVITLTVGMQGYEELENNSIEADTYSEIDKYVPLTEGESYTRISYEYENDVIELSKRTIRAIIVGFSITFIMAMIIIFIGINKSVKRIKKLRIDVQNICKTNDLDRRVQVNGDDEIGDLSRDINVFIDGLNDATTQLNYLASVDVMTGVTNRRVGLERLEQIIKMANEKTFPVTICYIDVDGLKHVNDEFGHAEGDNYLNSIVEVLKNHIRVTDYICRIGGDEFMIVFPHCTDDGAKVLMDRIEADDSLATISKKYKMSFSKGFVMYKGSLNVDAFIDLADKEMYIINHIYSSYI
jgi:diguanylate cyclase (GGDEF)-like protein